MLDAADIALLGDHLALDFVNTVEDRASDAPDDVLRAPGDLDRWADRVGLKPSRGRRRAVSHTEFAAALRFREQLHDVLKAAVGGTPIPKDPLRALQATALEAHGERTLRPDGSGFAWESPTDSPAAIRHRVALAAIDLLTDPELLGRTRLCSSEGCGWFYLDQSKNRSRRWCSMKGCGSREKAKRRAGRSARATT